MPDDRPQLLRRAAARVAEVDLVVAAAGAVACFRDGLVQCRNRRRFGGVRPDVQQLSAPALRPPYVLQAGQAGQVLLAGRFRRGGGDQLCVDRVRLHDQRLPPPAAAIAAGHGDLAPGHRGDDVLLRRVVHPPQPFQRHDPRRPAGELLQPEVRAVAHAVQCLHRLGELGAAGLTGPGHRHEPELGDIHDVHRTLAHLEQRLVAGRDNGHTIIVAAARPARKEPKVRNQRAPGIRGRPTGPVPAPQHDATDLCSARGRCARRTGPGRMGCARPASWPGRDRQTGGAQ